MCLHNSFRFQKHIVVWNFVISDEEEIGLTTLIIHSKDGVGSQYEKKILI